MAKITGEGLVSFAKSKIGTPYVYGTKGEVLTQDKINWLASSYPSTFTSSYIKKAKKFIGKQCTDCSGLISWYTGVVLSSSGLYSKAKEKHPISEINKAPKGAILWKSGHVGIYIGDGKCIEAKGIDYGTKESNVSNCGFKYYLIMDFIDYGEGSNADSSKDNWVKDLQAAINRESRTGTDEDEAYIIDEDGIAGPDTFNRCPVLVKGSKGAVVKVLQERLRILGYYKYEPTGKIGTGSIAAIKRYQKSKGLPVDGECRASVWGSLLGLTKF